MSLMIDCNSTLIWENKKWQCHREKGPALIFTSGYISYYLNGQLHRLYGPAIIDDDGSKDYCIHGTYYSKEDYYAKVKKL